MKILQIGTTSDHPLIWQLRLHTVRNAGKPLLQEYIVFIFSKSFIYLFTYIYIYRYKGFQNKQFL